MRVGLNLCAFYADIACPFIPDAAGAIRAGLGLKGAAAWPDAKAVQMLDRLERGTAVAPPDVLFRKVEDEQIADWSTRFSAG